MTPLCYLALHMDEKHEYLQNNKETNYYNARDLSIRSKYNRSKQSALN